MRQVGAGDRLLKTTSLVDCLLEEGLVVGSEFGAGEEMGMGERTSVESNRSGMEELSPAVNSSRIFYNCLRLGDGEYSGGVTEEKKSVPRCLNWLFWICFQDCSSLLPRELRH
jgi:hypothetical protein